MKSVWSGCPRPAGTVMRLFSVGKKEGGVVLSAVPLTHMQIGVGSQRNKAFVLKGEVLAQCRGLAPGLERNLSWQ